MAAASELGRLAWRVKRGELILDRPFVLGVLNVTPDSFSDGGQFESIEAALVHVERMVEEGADAVDIGGESTRPQGARSVSAEDELRRVVPIVRQIRRRFVDLPISVDTTKSEVADVVLQEGADIINDVSGLRIDRRIGEVAAAANAGIALMHSRGAVEEMGTYRYAVYGDDVVADVLHELQTSLQTARAAGIPQESIVLDPGIGFAKQSVHSVRVLAGLERLLALGCPLMVGVSRKRFIGELSGVVEARDRVAGTIGANVAALMRGARLFRVHDVAPNRQALDVAWAVLHAGDQDAGDVAGPEPGSRFPVPGSHRP